MSLLSRTIIGLYLIYLSLLAYLWWGKDPYHIDSTLYAYPDHWINLEAFRKGLIPLWNPYIGCGTPHMANWQSACFYPPFWLFNFTGLSEGYMGMALAHATFAFIGCFLWLKSQKIIPLGCALGALSFAASAHLTLCLANLPFIATAAWIPWIFWTAKRALKEPALKNWLGMGFCLSLQVLAGYPFFTFYTILFLLVWFQFQKPTLEIQKAFWITLGTSALATSLQWLPFLEMLTYSKPDKWSEYPYFDRPLDYLTLLKPDFLGLLGTTSYRGPFANGMFNLYFGLIPLAILASGIFLFFRLKKPLWTLASLLWLLWLSGAHFPPWNLLPSRLLEWLEPSKAVGLFLFCAVTSVALSLNGLWGRKGNKGWEVSLAVLVAALWMGDLLRLPPHLLKPQENPYLQTGLAETSKKLRDLSADCRLLSLRRPGDLEVTGASGEVLGSNSRFSVSSFLANSNAVWGIRSVDRYLFLQVDGSENLVRYFNKGFPYRGDLLDVAGVRLFLMPQNMALPKYRTLGKIADDFLIVDPGASVRFRFVNEKKELDSRQEILYRLSQPGSEWAKKVYLEKGPQGRSISLAPSTRTLAPGLWEPPPFEDYSEAYLLPFHNNFPGYYTWNETYTPGWRAWLDDKPVPILRSYGLFMAAAIPVMDGDHRLVFRYEPTSFRLGLFITLLALAGFSAGLLRIMPGFSYHFEMRRKKR